MPNTFAPPSWRWIGRWLLPGLFFLSACGTLQVLVEGTPAVAPTADTPLPWPTPSNAVQLLRVTFEPSTSAPLNRQMGFSFGARLEFDCDCDTTAVVTAFFLRPADSLPDCHGAMNVTLPFWAEQADFSSGPHTFDRRGFAYQDEASANALVIRASLLNAGRSLYCTQQVYPLTPSSSPATPVPASSVYPIGVGVAILSERVEAGHHVVSSSPVLVVATAPDATRVEFYTSATGTNAASQLEYVDTDASDGWVWSWPAPPSAMQAQVWVVAEYADGTRRASPALYVATPDVVAVLPTPTLSPTPPAVAEYVTPTPLPCKIDDLPGYASPDGNYVADDNGVVLALKDGRCTRMRWPKWVLFMGWTSDSRYAIYTLYDQYGNSATVGFDTQTWTQFSAVPENAWGLGDMQGRNGNGPVAVAPSSLRVLTDNGDVIRLPDSPQGNVLVGTGKTYVARGAWSPDETRLAFLAYSQRYYPFDIVLFLAQGNGTQAQLIMPVDFINWEFLTLAWSADGKSLVVGGDINRYTLDVGTGQVQAMPATPTAGPSPVISQATETPAVTMTPIITPTP
jgi:hypothetical protein